MRWLERVEFTDSSYSPFTIYDLPVGLIMMMPDLGRRDDTAKRDDHECEESEPGADRWIHTGW